MKNPVSITSGLIGLSLVITAFVPSSAWALISGRVVIPNAPNALSDRLQKIRIESLEVQKHLITGLHTRAETAENLRRVKTLIKLQQEEGTLSQQRLRELELTISDLEIRRGQLHEKINTQQADIRKFLGDLDRSSHEMPNMDSQSKDRIEGPRRKVLATLVERGLKEMEALKIDLSDANELEKRIQDEQQQLTYVIQDLKEQESILELNRQVQADLLKRKYSERVSQLEKYRKLKTSELQVEGMIHDFNARRELERTVDAERAVSKAMLQGEFGRLRGKLPRPVEGKVLSGFGPSTDPQTQLQIFKKGIDIEAGKNVPVRAISAGRVVYSGELPGYGRVTIVDHGDHFYSLCAHLGGLSRKVGDAVAEGDLIGQSDDQGTPVYFEIRARNIAVNPLQWLSG